jgi:hypothetical protein
MLKKKYMRAEEPEKKKYGIKDEAVIVGAMQSFV